MQSLFKILKDKGKFEKYADEMKDFKNYDEKVLQDQIETFFGIFNIFLFKTNKN